MSSAGSGVVRAVSAGTLVGLIYVPKIMVPVAKIERPRLSRLAFEEMLGKVIEERYEIIRKIQELDELYFLPPYPGIWSK